MMNTTHPSHNVSYNIENELVEQKNMILSKWNQGYQVEAITMLEVCKPVWLVTSYGYKIVEIVRRFRSELREYHASQPVQATRKLRETQNLIERIDAI
jgi:hypothetical protein